MWTQRCWKASPHQPAATRRIGGTARRNLQARVASSVVLCGVTDELRIYPRREREVKTAGRDFSAELNPEQLAAAEYGDGPLLIIAGAGTGKTRTLVYRVAHLIERDVKPE